MDILSKLRFWAEVDPIISELGVDEKKVLLSLSYTLDITELLYWFTVLEKSDIGAGDDAGGAWTITVGWGEMVAFEWDDFNVDCNITVLLSIAMALGDEFRLELFGKMTSFSKKIKKYTRIELNEV